VISNSVIVDVRLQMPPLGLPAVVWSNLSRASRPPLSGADSAWWRRETGTSPPGSKEVNSPTRVLLATPSRCGEPTRAFREMAP
jgi:hypothetical protein